MAGEKETVAVDVKYAGGDGKEVTYQLKPGDNSALDKSDLEDVATYATEKKLTQEQAAEFISHREKSAAGVRARHEAANKPPDEYELKLQEGSLLDQADIDAIATYAKDNKLTQAQAATLLSQRELAAVSLKGRQQTLLDTTVKQWEQDVKTDPEIGGDKFVVTVKNTKRVMDRFAPEGSKFKALLDQTGYGNHPEFVRFVNSIGVAMGEDGDIGRGKGKEPEKSLADKMYPSMATK